MFEPCTIGGETDRACRWNHLSSDASAMSQWKQLDECVPVLNIRRRDLDEDGWYAGCWDWSIRSPPCSRHAINCAHTGQPVCRARNSALAQAIEVKDHTDSSAAASAPIYLLTYCLNRSTQDGIIWRDGYNTARKICEAELLFSHEWRMSYDRWIEYGLKEENNCHMHSQHRAVYGAGKITQGDEHYTVSQKKVTLLIFVTSLSDFIRFC